MIDKIIAVLIAILIIFTVACIIKNSGRGSV